jgi:hypothetical protein
MRCLIVAPTSTDEDNERMTGSDWRSSEYVKVFEKLQFDTPSVIHTINL